MALGKAHGMPFFLVASFPKADKPEFLANLISCNWPASLRDIYHSTDAFGFSKLVGRLRQGVRPFFTRECLFSTALNSESDADQKLLFESQGLVSSIAFSLHDAHLNHYIFVFSGTRDALPQEDVAKLYFGALELLDLDLTRSPQDGPREKLSARELECLRWSAAGKSSEEIAVILNISGHTVISYLKSAMRKLDSVNRMQAVARACRFRLL
ncbi:helix-turn-helix transcriptional regulator [Ciceribacter sp. L1K22]|uniref:helix-turn-helix transcriptional regulator n=1 Tax=Ciceribacter sp. L1K22 TaxID=2820275 RepID=UPI002485B2AB|nr:helix-turn-helix transcriptional regulator [Ciceribacter sp. L1K22]